MATFYLVRHGDTGIHDRIPGRSSGVHLDERGRAEARGAAGRLSAVALAAVYASPLERTRETALAVADPHGLEVHLLPALLEIDYGEWTGRAFAELETVPEWRAYNRFRSGTRVPGGELAVEVQARMVGALEELRRRSPEAAVAVVSHGDPIRYALAHYAGLPLDLLLRLTVSTGSVSALTVASWGAQVHCVNETGGLTFA